MKTYIPISTYILCVLLNSCTITPKELKDARRLDQEGEYDKAVSTAQTYMNSNSQPDTSEAHQIICDATRAKLLKEIKGINTQEPSLLTL